MNVVEQILVNGVLSGLVYMLMALGFTLVFGMMRIVNFAHGEFYMVSAFGVLVFNGLYGVDYPIALLLAVAMTGAMGLAIERVFLRPFVGDELGSMIMSLGVAVTLQSIALIFFGPSEQSINRPVSGVIELGHAIVPLDRAVVGICSIAILMMFYLFVKKTRWGVAMRAVAQDGETAALMGIRVSRIQSLGFVLATILAALAGGLMAPVYSVGPYMGELPMLKAFVIVILGGLGSVPGAVLGGLIIGLLESVFSTYFDATLALIASFAVVIGIILFKPTGILGQPIR
ncbi:branched-chain amino acid ABC transporter permease [Ochrobactrum teleogrylli]